MDAGAGEHGGVRRGDRPAGAAFGARARLDRRWRRIGRRSLGPAVHTARAHRRVRAHPRLDRRGTEPACRLRVPPADAARPDRIERPHVGADRRRVDRPRRGRRRRVLRHAGCARGRHARGRRHSGRGGALTRRRAPLAPLREPARDHGVAFVADRDQRPGRAHRALRRLDAVGQPGCARRRADARRPPLPGGTARPVADLVDGRGRLTNLARRAHGHGVRS